MCYTGITGGDFVQRLIFHVDVNSAFLSWEAARRVAMLWNMGKVVHTGVGD